jgi:hypothetical protein
MTQPSAARRGLDKLLAALPNDEIARLDSQQPNWHRTEGPWIEVDFENGERFAIWKYTGAVYRVNTHGAVEDDPWLTPER